jgi:hypothetical protein
VNENLCLMHFAMFWGISGWAFGSDSTGLLDFYVNLCSSLKSCVRGVGF